MIRNLPVDTSRLGLLATGHCNPVQEWVELSDGSRRPSGNQQREKREDGTLGAPLWTVDALVPGEERADLISVQVAAQDQPRVGQFQPLHLEGLTARVSVGRDGKLRMYWSATAVHTAGKQEQKAA